MPPPNTAQQRGLTLEAQGRGRGTTCKACLKLSGPGWLQGAITVGGGSLAGSLYLGIIGGYELMWLQPLMMVFGIVMLSAIVHVTLTAGKSGLPWGRILSGFVPEPDSMSATSRCSFFWGLSCWPLPSILHGASEVERSNPTD